MERFTTLLICGGVLLFLWVTVLGLIFSDLWAGVRKAKKAGVFRTSDGYKKTIDKMARYYNMMLPLALMDTAVNGIVFYLYYFYHYDLVMLPWFSFVGAGYVAFVEITSIMEAHDVKERKNQQDFLVMVKALVGDRDPKSVIEALQELQKRKEAKDESK